MGQVLHVAHRDAHVKLHKIRKKITSQRVALTLRALHFEWL
jgi:hypothetical protein